MEPPSTADWWVWPWFSWMQVGDGTYVSLTPFHMAEPGRMAGQTNNNNN